MVKRMLLYVLLAAFLAACTAQNDSVPAAGSAETNVITVYRAPT